MKILYICTHNRCRSILFEAITNARAGDIITARSAGSQPAGEVHPLSIKYLKQAGYPTKGLCSQSWDEFEDFKPDIVITVCDSAASEPCPVWFGKAVTVHWGLSDPSKVTGGDAKISQAFNACLGEIEVRVSALKALAESDPDTQSLKQQLAQHGAVVS